MRPLYLLTVCSAVAVKRKAVFRINNRTSAAGWWVSAPQPVENCLILMGNR